MKLRIFIGLTPAVLVSAALLYGTIQLVQESSIRVGQEAGATMTTTAQTSTIRWWFGQ